MDSSFVGERSTATQDGLVSQLASFAIDGVTGGPSVLTSRSR